MLVVVSREGKWRECKWCKSWHTSSHSPSFSRLLALVLFWISVSVKIQKYDWQLVYYTKVMRPSLSNSGNHKNGWHKTPKQKCRKTNIQTVNKRQNSPEQTDRQTKILLSNYVKYFSVCQGVKLIYNDHILNSELNVANSIPSNHHSYEGCFICWSVLGQRKG